MKFLYTATGKDGKKSGAEIEAPNRQAALKLLKELKLTVTSLMAVERGKELYLSKISQLQKVVLTKHLAIMLHAGIALDEALRILEMQSKGKLRAVLAEVRQRVESGERLADAFSGHPSVFNTFYVNMVRAGEESGNLADNLEQLALRYGKDFELRRKAQSAMLYPALVLVLTGALGMVVSLFVLPRLTTLFRAFRFELPWYTRLLISVSEFMADYGILTFVLVILAVVGAAWLFRAPFAAPVVHRLYLRVPVAKEISRTVNLARFSMVLGSLLRSGVPITAAVAVTGNVLGNAAYRDTLLRAVPRVDTGEPLSSILEESPLFPMFTTRMLQVGEQTGKLEDMLAYLSQFYESELDNTLKNLSTLIEPVLLVTVGLIVAFVALSIITPIDNFIGQIE